MLDTLLPDESGPPKSRREHIINIRSVNYAIIQFTTGCFPVPSFFLGLNKFPVPVSREFARNGLLLLTFWRPFRCDREKFRRTGKSPLPRHRGRGELGRLSGFGFPGQ